MRRDTNEIDRTRCTLAGAVLCCGLALWCASGFADPIYSLTHITRKEGLPQSSVRAVAVDSRGFVWVGTEKGIARYDGYRFKEIASPLNAGVVVKLFVDSRDRVWTRWYGKPTTLYDPALDRWTVVETIRASSPEYIGEILEPATGRIWFTTNDRLYFFDERAQRLVASADVTPEPVVRYEQQYAHRIAFFRDAVWVAGHGEVVSVAARDAVARIPMRGARVVRLWVRNDALWMCNAEGVFVLRMPDMHWELFQRAPHPSMTSCLFDAAGALWMGFVGSGVVRVHEGLTRHFQHREEEHHADRRSLAANYVINLQLDSRGQVWVITPGVAHRWSGGSEAGFERFEFSPDSQAENPGGIATDAFVEDRNGVLWLGSEDHGLARLSAYARKVQWLAPPSAINAHVRSAVMDGQGNIWMGMNQDGVYRWNRATASWTHFAAATGDATQLPTREVRALFATRSGDIWAGSQRGGIVSRFDPANDSWRRYDLGTPGVVFNFLELPDGELLIGGESGVTRLDPRTRRVRRFDVSGDRPFRASTLSRSGRVYLGTHQHGVMEWIPGHGFGRSWREMLSDRNVFALYEDREGALWIGTWGGGLNRLRPDTGEVQVISTQDGLPDSTIFGILPGQHDDVWVSTNNGLARIENCIGNRWPCRPKVTVLDTRTGLPFSEFDAEAHALAPDGTLLFGGYEGLIRFDPNRLELNRVPPRPQISAIYLHGRELPLSAGHGAPLELQHDFGGLRIQFSALDLNDPANNRYKYRLSADEWLPLGTASELVLTDLARGKHKLELMGTNADGVWSERPLELSFRVAPPWYSSASAWLAYLVAALIGLIVLVKWRERRLRVNAARLENTVAERTRELADATHARAEFYANVSHEIRTPLTLLSATAERLKEPHDARAQGALAADLVRHSDSLRRYVESLITVSHLQSSPSTSWMREDVTSYLRSLSADFERIAGKTRIALDAPNEECFVRSYPNALDTIFSNLLLNAIRHTPVGGTIRVTVEGRPDSILVTLCDTGSGIDPRLLPRLFDRGARGGETSRTSSGHGIGLNLVKQTVLALGGSISARNQPAGGACFSVALPRAAHDLPLASYARTPMPVEPSTGHRTTPPPAPSPGKRRGSILVIEDHDELRGHVVKLFAPNYRVREAPTAQEGLAAARKYLPDVVICDVMLPDGEGFDVVAALKSDAITDHMSIVLLTALADEASRLRGLTAEADLYVTKPFSRDLLVLQVTNLMNQRRRLRRATAQEAWAAKASSLTPTPKAAGFEERLLAALEDLHAHPECDVDALAKHLALSRKQLERKTRYCFKCTPKLLLNRYRLDKARALLEAGAKVNEVATLCGFASQSHFGVLYKKCFGHPPSRKAGPAAQ